MTFRQFAYRNVARNKRTYAAYFVSSAFSVMIFFVCTLFIFNPTIREGLIVSAAVQAMIAAECIMYLFAFFFVWYSVSSFLNSRKREFGIYLMHGMTKRQLNQMVFWENMIIGFGAILTGMIAGLLMGKLFLMISSAFLSLPGIPLYVPWESLALTIGSFALLFFIISLFTSALIGTNKLVELFQSGQSRKDNPRVSIVLSIMAAVLLVISYYLAATAAVTTVYSRMIPVIIMTIIGTYFLYTQLIAYLVTLLKKYKQLFWRKTNVITVASLTYRFKDHANMFFMVTIISTISFCSVGVFASINTLMKSFQEDYPAAIGYLSKQGNNDEQEHLARIKAELTARDVSYETITIPIKYVNVYKSTDGKWNRSLPILSFSDYEKAIKTAGYTFDESRLSGHDGLVIITSQREKSYIRVRQKVTYQIEGMTDKYIREIGYTEHVPLPDYLAASLEIEMKGDFGGIVVSDELFGQIAAPTQLDRYTGFYVEDLQTTSGIANDLVKNGVLRYDSEKFYAMTVSGTLYDVQRSLYSMMLLVSLLVGAVFFIAAGSFLYFRLYADLDYDRRQYAILAKVGLTEKELNTIVTRQLAILFFVPTGIAVIHSLFAFTALQSLFYLSVAAELGIVLISFVIAQLAYFYLIRQRYLRNLKKRGYLWKIG
ncbi:MAG: ABC transporter permease [Candidatus Pristimantibacillus sp.]